MILKQYDKIYYHGDMANLPGFGHIKKITTDRWGTQIFINMEDGRKFIVSQIAFSEKFSGNGSTRFVLKSAYDEFKQEQIEKFKNFITQQNRR